jgi:hypothetical protein
VRRRQRTAKEEDEEDGEDEVAPGRRQRESWTTKNRWRHIVPQYIYGQQDGKLAGDSEYA